MSLYRQSWKMKSMQSFLVSGRCQQSHMRNYFSKMWKKFTDNPIETPVRNYEVVEPRNVSARRDVPSCIPKPPYSKTSIPEDGPWRPEIKNANQIESMRHSCTFVKEILAELHAHVKPGVTTDKLDEIVHEIIISNGAYPSPLNYRGFPKSICTSVNNVVCHGIPDDRPLKLGDIVNVDVTVFINGYHGDSSMMYIAGECDEEAKQLINVTELCLSKGIEVCKPNENFSSIGAVIQETAQLHGFTVIPSIVGHGIGTYFHGPPDIFHIKNNYPGKMQPGMTFTIEPALTTGSKDTVQLDDDWTIVTEDNKRTAQAEHTVLITETGCEVLTL